MTKWYDKRRKPERPHKWVEGGIKNGNPTLACQRDECNATWYPHQTESQKGECTGK